MRAALWLLALFAVAVAAALFAGNNQSTLTVFWPPHRIDLSLNLVLPALATAVTVAPSTGRGACRRRIAATERATTTPTMNTTLTSAASVSTRPRP